MSEAAAATGPIRTTLIDIGNCIGCRACQVACKQWNEQDGEQTQLESDLGFQNPATLSARTYTLIAFNEFENAAEAGRHGIRVRDAALSSLPGAGVRLRLPDDGALPAGRRSGVVQRGQVHRLPILPAGMSLGRADLGMELARAEDLEVHALRRPRRAAGADRVQRRRRSQTPRTSGSAAVSRPPPASRRARPTPCSTAHVTRCSPKRTSASPTGPTGTSITFTERRSWAGRACCTSRGCRSRNSASRLTGKSPFRPSARRRSAPFPPP